MTEVIIKSGAEGIDHIAMNDSDVTLNEGCDGITYFFFIGCSHIAYGKRDALDESILPHHSVFQA